MGKLWIPGSGSGAGSGSDECTASKSEVLKGYSAVTSDSDDEPVQGTLELVGDASDGQVLFGKTYYNTDPKKKRTGSMANQGAVSVKLNAGEGYTIPSGFHNGGGKVEANGLASQTPGTATSAHILSGQSAWVNGNKVNGGIPLQNIEISGTDRAWAQGMSNWAGTINLKVRNGHYLNGVNWIQQNIPEYQPGNIKKGVNIGGVVGTFEGYVPTATDLYSYGNNIAGWYDAADSISLDSTAITIKDAGFAYMVTTKAYEHASYSRLNIIALVQRQNNGGCTYGFQDQRTAKMFGEITNVTTIGEYTVSIPFNVSGVMTLRLKFWNYYTYAMQIKRIWLS